MQQIEIPVLKGQNFILRTAQASDASSLVGLARDPTIHKMYGGSAAALEPPYNEIEAQQWVKGIMDQPCAWVIDVGIVIGTARLDGIDLQDRRASYAIGIHSPEWLGKGIGTEATNLVLGFAFTTLQLHRISLRVIAYNTRAIRSYEKSGFVVEGLEREAGFVDGEWHDDVMMGILDREFEKLNR
ncbi:GNAT family N-acetyltransferase [Rhizobium leguminosarum bv. viciae]|nr:GNAT family protein [Rhizobium leguminosarum]NKL67142.1 GNAT family N-acetyltransferase [Rhizobium leguminosarum bv. viciae]